MNMDDINLKTLYDTRNDLKEDCTIKNVYLRYDSVSDDDYWCFKTDNYSLENINDNTTLLRFFLNDELIGMFILEKIVGFLITNDDQYLENDNHFKKF